MKASIAYSREMAQEILDLIADGDVLKDICRRDHMPVLKNVRRWLKDRPEFAASMAEAEKTRLFSWEDELISTARDNSRDRIQKDTEHGYVPMPDSAAVSRSKLQCETIARRLRAEWPEKYGNSVTLKQPKADLGEMFATMPIEQIEAMAANAKAVEDDAELAALLQQKRALDRLNKERRERGEPPLSFGKFIDQ